MKQQSLYRADGAIVNEPEHAHRRRTGTHSSHRSRHGRLYCRVCRLKMKPYHVFCPYCGNRIWSVWLLAAGIVLMIVLFWGLITFAFS